MGSNDAPCKDCKDREIGCHCTCEKYKEFCAERERIRTARRKEMDGTYWRKDVRKRFQNSRGRGKVFRDYKK